MGSAGSPEPSKLFVAVLYKDGGDGVSVVKALERKYGPIDFRYGPVPFTHSAYYRKEMGPGLQKLYLTFAEHRSPADCADIKVAANALEGKYVSGGKRRVNIDPGYLTRDKLVLASTKNFFHRIYLSKGIYAEVTLHFRGGRFRYFSWTYPDYREPQFDAFLRKPRARLVKELRQAGMPSDT